VIVRDRIILATGYNGSPSGMPHCTELGCLITTSTTPEGDIEENCFRTIHAEINAIAQAAKTGVSISGSHIYITHSPCIHCLKVLINTGIGRVFYGKPYKLDGGGVVRLSGIRLEEVAVEARGAGVAGRPPSESSFQGSPHEPHRLVNQYAHWLHTQWPAGTVEKLPERTGGRTNPGLFVEDLTGVRSSSAASMAGPG
jgi:deoxycytidylate deaminase